MTTNDYTNVIEVQNLSDGNFILRVKNPGIKFYPGQFFSLGISDMSINREYSVASSSKREFIDFFIREVEGGSLTPSLRKLKRGDKIKILGPYGEFYLREFDKNSEYIFIATGTGLAPFMSIIEDFNIKNYKVYHGVRHLNDAYTNFDWSNYNLAVSREKTNFEMKSKKIHNIQDGYVDKYIDKLSADEKMLFFLCGNSLMVSNIYDNLLEKNVNPQKIFTEIFF